jgi:hypothetical protein
VFFLFLRKTFFLPSPHHPVPSSSNDVLHGELVEFDIELSGKFAPAITGRFRFLTAEQQIAFDDSLTVSGFNGCFGCAAMEGGAGTEL